ncbi:tetratricopeptide repeat protein [Flavobacterium sp. F-328]|uniref:Tetratricopeptide repeat protein n=1 Tax=Flavobacterium erciyesense TaxID=2825842 RepID=A0ABS5D3X0_9FLAO|nr:tetratricopeptide repeat protein [Flavobacterium erciyesense]MBQ0908686.1 tetratricopeptide repeat protein [Flavobacterium erciyesense]
MLQKKYFFTYFALLLASGVFAQKEGYWDKARATTQEIQVSARDRMLVKTQDLPEGTTEILFRITLLDKNHQMASSLVSVLKAIPDPTGISQGSAGAVFLLSKISGDDTCKYAVFTSASAAQQYVKDGSANAACFEQSKAVSKDAQLLSADKSLCLQQNSSNLWFAFESKNWIMSQKIILEVVPWVDTKLSRGWTVDSRKAIIEQCKTSNLAKKMSNSDDFCVCILDKIQNKYKAKEFTKLLPAEQSKAFKDFGNNCYGETSLSQSIYADLRTQATTLAKQGKPAEAITQLLTIVNDGQATALDYNALGRNYLMTKQYGKAIKYLQEGAQKDPSELLIQLNLAHAYLLNDNFSAAKKIHKTYQNQNVTAQASWVKQTELDFAAFAKAGIQSADFDRILKLLR